MDEEDDANRSCCTCNCSKLFLAKRESCCSAAAAEDVDPATRTTADSCCWRKNSASAWSVVDRPPVLRKCAGRVDFERLVVVVVLRYIVLESTSEYNVRDDADEICFRIALRLKNAAKL